MTGATRWVRVQLDPGAVSRRRQKAATSGSARCRHGGGHRHDLQGRSSYPRLHAVRQRAVAGRRRCGACGGKQCSVDGRRRAPISAAALNPAYLESLADRSLAASPNTAEGHGLGSRPGPQAIFSTSGMPLAGIGDLGWLPETYDLRSLGRSRRGIRAHSARAGLSPRRVRWSPAFSPARPRTSLRTTWSSPAASTTAAAPTTGAATSTCPPPIWRAGEAPSTRAKTPTGTASRRRG